ncbi:40S ribosomal protein S2-3 [Capsicum baccatum]|uniref:Small ribosomal subunit protein uS5 n=1 Tax=Capsicum baccatum TaxID=33114 RepID=A0A2G2WJW7_CAPBA|nr:40S ribosomal protein S2-3 [Capsicum baccatum]
MVKRGEFGREFGGRGGRGSDCGGRGRGGRRPRRDTEEEKWVPITKLESLVKDGKIKSLEQIYLHLLPIKEYQIIDNLIGPSLKDECSKKVTTAIRGAIILAKWSVIPVRRGYWGNKIGKPHIVPCKVTGKCGSITVRMVPALRGDGIVVARVPKKVLQFSSIKDVFIYSCGSTKTLGNFVKMTSDGEGNRPHCDKILMSTARRNLGCL